ncbi:MAG: hypothetical protein WC415_02945 [Patescibacteria group bacterium]|jgi:hypothetical protein
MVKKSFVFFQKSFIKIQPKEWQMKKKGIISGLLAIFITLIVTSTVNAYTVSYYVKDAYWQFYGNPLDHTYACVSYNNHCYAIGNSTTSGGSNWGSYYLNQQNSIYAICVAGCYMVWGTHGTCHQHTNRLLYFANTTISSSVQGYTLSKFIFGTYGTNFADCLNTCVGL